MFWNWDPQNLCIISPNWKVDTPARLTALCIGLIILVIILEFLRVLTKKFDAWIVRRALKLGVDEQGKFVAEANSQIGGTLKKRWRGFGLDGPDENSQGPVPRLNPQTGSGAATPLGERAEQFEPVELVQRVDEVPEADAEKAVVASVKSYYVIDPVLQLLRALLYGVICFLSYFIMLVAMSFNGFIIISIAIGAVLGKFICDWMAFTIMVGTEPNSGVAQPVVGNGGIGASELPVCC